MKNTLLILLLLLSFTVDAQTSETKYYRARPFDTEIPKDKAKYSVTITEENGVVTTVTRDLKKNRVESAWRGDEPVGKWVGLTGRGPEELDYDFKLRYEEGSCTNPETMQSLSDPFSNDATRSYTAPVVDSKDGKLMSFIVQRLRYPGKARRAGIQGDVHLAFRITAGGIMEDVVVTKGVHIVLDKEAARVVRALKFTKPAMLNGKPQDVCVKMPLKFRLH